MIPVSVLWIFTTLNAEKELTENPAIVVLGPGSLGKESEQANSSSRNLAGTAYVRTLSVLQLPQLRKTNGMRSNY